MAKKRRDGAKDGSWGVSEKALAALDSGQYGQLTGRQSKYNTSSQQTQQARELPKLEGLWDDSSSDKIWESNYGRSRRQYVDTNRARRKYESRAGHNASDFRDLRKQGYGSSYTDIDFSKVSDFDKELLDAALENRNSLQERNARIRSYAPGSAGAKFNEWLNSFNTASNEDKIAEAQSYIDKYGKSKDEVLDAYKMYKESEERRKREESPYLAGFKDFKSAPDRGLASFVKRASNEYFPGSDLESIGDWLQEKTGVKEVEKQRDYSRNSNKIGAVKKAFLDPYFQYGDLASTELAGALLGGGMAMADPAVGFGLSIEPTAGLGTAIKAGTGYGLTAQEKYDELIKQGVDPEKASQMANMSGLSMAAAMGANKLIPSLGAETPLATRLLTNGGISGTVMAARQAADQIADMLMLGDQSSYNANVKNYMAQGKSESEAHNAARNDLLASDLGAYLFGMLTGAGSELVSNGMSKALSKGVNEADDTLNSVWANQPALEDKGVPRLTGTVNNTQALPGSGNLPALVDNIYPIQMPGTQGVIEMPGTNGVIAPMIEGASTPAYANEAATKSAPKVVAKLTGYELEKAVSKRDKMAQELASIKEQIPKQYEIASTSVKSKKNAEFKKLEALRAKEAGLTYDLYALDRKINGQSEVSKTDKHMLTELSKDIKKVGNMYGGKEGKAIAKQAIDALERYEKSGLVKDYFDFYNNVIALENASVNPYTSKSGNTSTYSTYHNAENGGLLTRMTAPPQSDDEEPSLVFKALMSLLDMNQRAGESAPVDVPVEVNPDDVIYHSGILSRLNKADSAGKMQGSRDTGYYGTGHYFVDQAHKSSIGKNSGYGDKPYTSVDISKYNNLFRADTDEKASQLHDFSQKMMRYVNKHNDRYYTEGGKINKTSLKEYMDDMYAEYKSLFGKKAMGRKKFEARLKKFRDEYEYDFYDRGDSAITTFMKEHGYNGVDTRGTNSANTERGVVIYDLDEDSILQSNVTDEAVKNGLMNTRVRNGQPLFDEETDTRLQKEIDALNKKKQIKQEYKKLYDEKKLSKIDKEIEKTEERIKKLENDIIPYEQLKANKDPELFEMEYKQFRRIDPDITREQFADIFYDNLLDEGDPLADANTELTLLKGKLEELQKAYASEEKLSEAAYNQARDIVSGVIPEEDLDAAVVESMEDLYDEDDLAPITNEIVPQTPQNVNPVPEVTNDPNFSLVGEPYTPQEVPNVQNTPPTTPPPTQEVPNMDGKMKTSEYYNNTMRGTETNRNMSDKEYSGRFDEETFKRMTIPEQKSVSMGRDFIKESGGEEKAIQRLLNGEFDSEERFSGYHIDAAEMLANSIEQQALDLEAQGQDASQLWRTANKLHKKIQLNASDFGVGLQALQKWKKSTPQGAFDDLISQVNKGIDKKKTTGYSRNVNTLADKIVDAVESSDNKADMTSKIKNIFAEDRAKNPYNTDKAEQLVLDLVGGDKNTKMSITDLADEAGKLIKKQMGVSSLTPKEERAVLNLLDAASQLEPGTRAYNELVSQAMVIVDESLPVTAGEKFKSLLYDNMLASIKTMFTRNFGGNVVGNAIDAMAAPFQVGADAVVGKFTGARTRSLTGKSIVEATKGLGHGFKDWGLDIGYSLKNKTAFNTPRSGQESLADVLQAVHKTWKTQSQNKAVKAVHNALSAYDYIIRKGMEGGDRPIYEAQYAATKAELYDVVDKYGDAGIRKGLPADKRDIDTDDLIEAMAINEALEAVLQNDSKMKEAAKNLKSFFKKSSEDMLGVDVASMSHAPFVEVPANMASNFFKLTPIGWAGNIARTIGEKKKYGNINQRRFTGELGLNVLGGLMGAGLFAVADKYISDKISDKKEEKKIQQNNGYQEYALQTPDEGTQIDISDIPYLGGMMKFSKLERDAYNEGEKTGGTAGGIKSALSEIPSAASAATVDTLYSALNRLTGADFQYNGDSNLITNAVNNIKSSVGSMGVPSLVRQTAQFTDPYKRDLGDYGTDEYNKNLIINGIPGLRQAMLEPKIDTAGNPVPELGGATGLSRFLSAYVSPWKVSHPHENTSAVQEYANMLNKRTEGKVNPQMKVINKSDLTGITGYDAENYSHADLRKLQEAYYKSNTELGNALINDPWFTNLSDEKQGELLNELWTANKALVKENFVRDGLTPEQIEAKGDELYTTDNKLAQILRDDDKNHTGLLKWLKDETGRDEMNAKYGTNMTHDKYVDYNSREEGYAEQRASEADKAKALDMSVDSYEKYEAEYPGGAQAYHDDKEAAKQYGFVKSDKTVNLDAYNIAKELSDGDPEVMQAYADYKQEGIKSNAYGAKAAYLVDDDRFTDEQKGMIIAGSQDGSKVGKLAKGAKGAYDIGNSNNNHDGYAGVYYYYLLKNQADSDGSGTVSKKERQAFFEQDNPYLDELWNFNQDMYEYLMKNLK